jgi:hypothetical protein
MSWLTVKLLAYVSGALFVACLLLSAGWYVEDASHDRTKAQHQAANDRAKREFSEAARKAEQAQAAKYAEVEARHQQELTDAQGKADRVVADLRAGNLSLRRHWQGCQATAGLSSAAARAAFDAETARLREEAAGRVVRLGAECDARIRGLQGLIR